MDWVSFDITAPVAKQNFLNSYFEAAKYAFTQHNIRVGFLTTGLVPINHHIMPTPSGSRDIKKVIRGHRQNLSHVDHARIKLLGKAGKALDVRNVQIASLQAENHRVRQELKARKVVRRRAVKFDANETFANIEDIHSSQEEARGAMQEDDDVIVVQG
ncbi:hypothetical protein B0T24DRAFT_598767 [Lasiosphaeria ovina]|uniref:Uncharacterized protein n=1 Tax=Lasiosphaeria ovina TaxID=92902 RepID=A0AAE0JU17_9PEZI|nr:hypothetical protein B0T24DRAFT_598767 [Lasiosphaeria ovina]